MTKTESFSKQIVKLTVILLVVSAVTSLVLGLTNMVTKDRIEEQSMSATAAAYKLVLEAKRYDSVEFSTADFATVNGVYKADDVGHVVELTVSGAMGSITLAVGIDTSGAVTGVEITESAETSGLGSKAAEPAYKDQYLGATEHVALTTSGGTIQAISGATITSKAVTDAVNTAMDVVASVG